MRSVEGRDAENAAPAAKSASHSPGPKFLGDIVKEAGQKLKEGFKDSTGKMQEGGADMMSRAFGGSNVAAVQALTNKSGEQMISAFLVQSLRSAKSRREQASSAASELAQTLILQHSSAATEPLYAAVQRIVQSIGAKILESAVEVVVAFVLRRLNDAKAFAAGAAAFALDVLDAVTPDSLQEQAIAAGWAGKPCLQMTAAGVLLFWAWAASRILGTEVLGGMAFGAAAGMALAASYERSRALRQKLIAILSTEWHLGYKKQKMASLGITADMLTMTRVELEGICWLNAVLSTLWPKIAYHLGSMIMSGSNNLLDHFKPSFLSYLGVTRCELGNLPIEIRKLKVNKLNKDELEITATATWQGQVAIDLEMETFQAVKFHNEIRHLFFRGEFKVIAGPLVPVLPGFAALRVSLVSPPKLDFDVNIKSVVSPPAVVAWLKRFILESVDDILLWPNRLVIPLLPEERVGPFISPLLRSTKGIIRVKVLSALDLPNEDVDLFGRQANSDPYVLLDTARQEFKTTKTVANTQNPVWNEVLYLQIFELNQRLHVEVWDADDASADDLLGRCAVNLLELEPGCLHDRWYELGRRSFHAMEGTGTGFGRIRLAITWWPVQQLQNNLGSGLVEMAEMAARKNKAPELPEEPIQEGILLVKLQHCTKLPVVGDGIFSAEIETSGTKHKSSNVSDADGAPVFSFSCEFYEIKVSDVLTLKVFSHSQKLQAMVGVLQVPLALAALSSEGTLKGCFPLAGPELSGSSITFAAQWLPLDCNAIPFPPKRQDPEHGCLFVHLDRANDLINADARSLSDPYVVLKFGYGKKTSKVIDDDLNPVWDESFSFMGTKKDVLSIHVWDKDVGKSDSLGQVFVPVSAVLEACQSGPTDAEGRASMTMMLAGVKSGDVTIRAKWVPVYGFAKEMQEAVCTRKRFDVERIGDIPAGSGLLEQSVNSTQHWRKGKDIAWKGQSTSMLMQSLRSRREEEWGPHMSIKESTLPFESDKSFVKGNSFNSTYIGEGHKSEMKESDHQQFLMTRDIQDSSYVMWSVLVVLHSLEGLAAHASAGEESLHVLHAVLRIGEDQHAASMKINDWGPIWKEGFEWQGMPLDSKEDLVVSFSLGTEETLGLGDAIADLRIPLAMVRAQPRRSLSGTFRLQNRDGSAAIRSAGLEVCWVRHRDENTEATARSRRLSLTTWEQITASSIDKVGALRVHLISGTKLPIGDSTGLSDPFCTLKIGEKRFVSSVKQQTLEPEWDQEFEYSPVTLDRVLRIKCYDKDRFSKQLLGTIDIPVNDVASAPDGRLCREFPLKQGGKSLTGCLVIGLQWAGWTHKMMQMEDEALMRKTLAELGGTSRNTSSKALPTHGCSADEPADLQVELKSARGLLAHDSNGLSDPYVTLKLRDKRHVSEVKPKNLNPVWNSSFVFQAVSSQDTLRINVWDKDMMSKDLMGRLEIPVSSVIDSGGLLDGEWQLHLNGQPAGMLALKLQWGQAGCTGATAAAMEPAAAVAQQARGSDGQEANEAPPDADAQVEEAVQHGPGQGREPLQAMAVASFAFATGELPPESPAAMHMWAAAAPEARRASGPVGSEQAARTTDITPASTQPPTPAQSDAGVPRLPQSHIPARAVRVTIHGLREVPPALRMRSVFLALKLDKERATTPLRAVSGSGNVNLGSVLDIPYRLPPSRLYLRVRLYERKKYRRKLLAGEVNIPLREIERARILEGAWPIPGIGGVLDVTLQL